jgi:hypothetical protein
MAKIIDFLSRADRETAGCGFLATADVEAWLEGTLSASRGEEFERHRVEGCAPCALLAADVAAFLAVDQHGTLDGERREFEDSAPEVRARLDERAAAPRARQIAAGVARGRWGWIAGLTAASVLVVIALLPRPGSAPTDGRIPLPGGGVHSIATGLPFTPPPSVRDAQALTALWQEAGLAHEARDYARSGRLFAQIRERDPQSHDAALYHGYALLMTLRYDEAVAALGRALELADEQGLVGASDNLYLGMAAMGQRDLELARRALGRARSLGGPFADEATVLLEQLP